ncbi:DUF3592 domain-containing protein [Chitinophaga lutea]
MIIVYILMLVIGAIPLWRTIRYIRLEERIRKTGIRTSGTVTHIHTTRHSKGPATDRVHVRYSGTLAGQYHEASFVAKYGQYRRGQSVPVRYLPEHPDKIVVAEKRGYWLMLGFSIAIILFVCFAIFKIAAMER